MQATRNGLPGPLLEAIEIHRDPRLTGETVLRKYRIVIEDDATGQEFAGFSGLSRKRAEEIAGFIKLKGDHDLATGRLPPRKPSAITDEPPPRTRGKR